MTSTGPSRRSQTGSGRATWPITTRPGASSSTRHGMCVARRSAVTIVANGCARTISRATSTSSTANASWMCTRPPYPDGGAGRPSPAGGAHEQPVAAGLLVRHDEAGAAVEADRPLARREHEARVAALVGGRGHGAQQRGPDPLVAELFAHEHVAEVAPARIGPPRPRHPAILEQRRHAGRCALDLGEPRRPPFAVGLEPGRYARLEPGLRRRGARPQRAEPRDRPGVARAGDADDELAGQDRAAGAGEPAALSAASAVSAVGSRSGEPAWNAARMMPTHTSVALATWNQTISAGSFKRYWTIPTTPWSAMSRQMRVRRTWSSCSASLRRASHHVATASSPSAAARTPWRSTSHVSVPPPRKSKRCTTSPVPEPPACGPAAVAAVPAKIVTAPSTNIAHTARAVVRSAVGGSSGPNAGRARQASAAAATSTSIDSP